MHRKGTVLVIFFEYSPGSMCLTHLTWGSTPHCYYTLCYLAGGERVPFRERHSNNDYTKNHNKYILHVIHVLSVYMLHMLNTSYYTLCVFTVNDIIHIFLIEGIFLRKIYVFRISQERCSSILHKYLFTGIPVYVV